MRVIRGIGVLPIKAILIRAVHLVRYILAKGVLGI